MNIQTLLTTQEFDSFMKVLLFSFVLAVFLTIIGFVSLLKKLELESFSPIYFCLVIFCSALVFSERELQPIVEYQEIISKIGINLWRIMWVTVIILLIWILNNLYSNIWSKRAFHCQLTMIFLLIVFQPTFFKMLKIQFYANPLDRIATLSNLVLLPRWNILIKEQIGILYAGKTSITNTLIILLYIAIWISFVILFFKISRKFEFKKTNQKIIDIVIKYGIIILLYFCPMQTLIVIGLLPFHTKEEPEENNKACTVIGKVRHW